MLDHLGIQTRDAERAAAFYDAVLATVGGARIMEPAPRVVGFGVGGKPEYHPTYYGGFVRDPDGNNVEAVCHHA